MKKGGELKYVPKSQASAESKYMNMEHLTIWGK